jgi:hypothetical protein
MQPRLELLQTVTRRHFLRESQLASELFGAAIASCHMTTARRIAEKRRVAYRRMTCQARIFFAVIDTPDHETRETHHADTDRGRQHRPRSPQGKSCAQ